MQIPSPPPMDVHALSRLLKIHALLSPDAPTDTPKRLVKLRQYYTVCYVLSECTALFGVALRYQGASVQEVIPFFLCALILFGLCYPRLPSDLESG